VPPSKYSYRLDGADKVEGEEEYGGEDERNIAAVEEVTAVIKQTLPIAQSIVEVPVKTSELTLTDMPAVPPDTFAQLNTVANSNHAQFSAKLLFLQDVINIITPSFVCHY
jgi:hypothetical protein